MDDVCSNTPGRSLLSIPDELLLQLADYIHNIEDYTSLRATCKTLRVLLDSVTPRTILRLAAAQSTTFFRPSPYLLVAATARELGDWARSNQANEQKLASTMELGIEGLLDLALEHCGLTLERIRQLHLMRFSIINPVTDVIDKCVGVQWLSTPNFWNGGVSDAYTVSAEASDTLFHLVIYGELFGPDFDAFLDRNSQVRSLSVDTRLQYVKYCIPDNNCFDGQDEPQNRLADGSIDPRRAVKLVGPYRHHEHGDGYIALNNNIGLVWVLRSSRWRPLWKEARALAARDFQDGFEDGWWYVEDDDQDWRQRMWEGMMLCQGLEGLGMIRPELRDGWVPKIKEWKEKVAALEKEPGWIEVGRQKTMEYPFLLGDLRVCGSGYVLGT